MPFFGGSLRSPLYEILIREILICEVSLYAHLGTPHEPNFGHPQLFLGWDSQLGVNRAFVQNFILNTMVFVFRAPIQIPSLLIFHQSLR